MKYIILFLLLIPLFIMYQICRFLFKRAKKNIRKCVSSIKNMKFQFNKNRSIYKVNSFIIRDSFDAVSFAIFICLMVSINLDVLSEPLRNFISKHIILQYIILIWFLYYLNSGCQYIRKLSNEINSLRITALLLTLIFIAILPTVSAVLLAINTDFVIVIIAILFWGLSLYYITVSMLDVIENPLLRISIGYIYSILIAVYTALAIGIYSFKIGEATGDLSTYTAIIIMISKGIVYLSQTSLKDIVMTDKDINLGHMMQLLIAGYGTLIIAHINKIALGFKEKQRLEK